MLLAEILAQSAGTAHPHRGQQCCLLVELFSMGNTSSQLYHASSESREVVDAGGS